MDYDQITSQAADCSGKYVADLKALYSPEAVAAILRGNLLALTGAYTAAVGAERASEFFFKCGEISIALGVPSLVGQIAVYDAIVAGAKRGGEPA